jgi:hypothetical protein
MHIRRAAAALAPLALLAAASPPERVIRAGEPVPVTLDGAPGQLLIDPGAPSVPLVTTDYATRAGLKPGPFALAYLVGPVKVPGRTAVARIDLGHGPEKKRVGWTERPISPGVDGSVGPGGLADDVVRFVLRDPVAGERDHALPMTDGGGLLGGAAGLFATIPLDGAPVRVRFDLRQRATITNAGTAQSLARTNRGTLAADTRQATIAFGVERPVRRMTLATPLAIGPLSLTALDVRATDYGSTGGIAADGAVPDPDEIVVTAKGKRDRSRDRITVGTDALARCSAITFDKRAKQVRLTCA